MKTAKRALSLLLSLLLVLGAVAVGGMSASADGDGIVFNSADNRYEISNYAGLKEFASIVNGTHAAIAQNQAACAILTQDFTATDTDWTPIGNNGNRYNGTFDGMGHIITGLTTPEGYGNYAGLFGCVGSGGKVRNVGLEGGSIAGADSVGGVAGKNNGTVESCYNTGAVSGNDYVGGVVGYNLIYSSVENCYNTGAVSGNDFVGGVVGYNSENSSVKNCYNTGSVTATGNYAYVGGVAGFNNSNSSIKNCYNTGAVSGAHYVGGVAGRNFENSPIENCYNTGDVSGGRYVGGVAGQNHKSSVVNCFYDSDRVSGVPAIGHTIDGTSTNVKGLTTADMTGTNAIGTAYNQMNFSDTSVWLVRADDEFYSYYPHLKGFDIDNSGTQIPTENIHKTDWPARLLKDGVCEISDYAELRLFASEVNGGNAGLNGILTKDIECKNDPSDTEYATDWTPIGYYKSGTDNNLFIGTFDGDGHKITGLTTPEGYGDYAGLFGYVGSGGKVRNVGLEGGSITGQHYVGGVVGYSYYYSSVKNCYNTGAVSGNDFVGGVVGENIVNSSVENCYNTGSITATATNAYVSGVVGDNSHNSSVENCYNTGSVTAIGQFAYVGGVVGYNYHNSTISNCYNTGSITAQVGSAYVGGVAGENYLENSSVKNCCYDSDRAPGISAIGVEVDATSSNVKGLTTTEMTGESALNSMVFEYGDGEENPWLTKADGADVSGKYYWFYPHLKGFDYDLTAASEDWPAKAEVAAALSEYSFGYDGLPHIPTVTSVIIGDSSAPEGASVTYSQYKYSAEDNKWEWDEISDSPTDPGNYRMTALDGDKVIETKYFTILDPYTDFTVSNYKKTGENWSPDTVTPVDAGNYKAVVTFTDTGYAKGHAPIEKEFEINPASVKLTANSRNTDVYDGTEKTVSGFTSSVSGLTFEGVTASGSGTDIGIYDVTFNGVTLNETKDTTGNYVVTETVNGTLTINPVITFVNENGSVLQSDAVAYGETPEYTGETPVKEENDGYTYEFSEWTPEITAATANATYTAVYTKTANKYTATFVDENGKTAAEVHFTVETVSIADKEPPVPEKACYSGEWESYTLGAGNITVKPVYTFSGHDWEEPVITAQDGKATKTRTCKNNPEHVETLAEYTVVEVPAGIADERYNGSEYTGVQAGDDYTLSGTVTAVNAGTYTATATLKEGYIWSDLTAGPKNISWEIKPRMIGFASEARLDNDTFTYDGAEKKPTLVFLKDTYIQKELKEGVDYKIIHEEWKNNINVSDPSEPDVEKWPTAIISVEGMGNYYHSMDLHLVFNIEKAAVTVTVTAPIEFTDSAEILEQTRLYGLDNGFSVKGDIPKGAKVEWYVNGEKAGEGRNFIVTEPKADYTVQAKLVDAQGNVLSETDEANIDINTGFFARLYWLFCSLIQRIIDFFKGTAVPI